jgi:hypothetical protein
MTSQLLRTLDPLDLEILEMALDAALITIKEKTALDELDSDEALEAFLRCELIEIARFNGVSDPETLRDILVKELPRRATPPLEQHKSPLKSSPQ